MGTSTLCDLDTRSFIGQSHVHGAYYGGCKRAKTALEAGESNLKIYENKY